MKSKKISIKIIIIIALLTLYHIILNNNLEKIFLATHYDYNMIKRPNEKCMNDEKWSFVSCIGMPSGHTEAAAVFFILLYLYKFIPLWVCILFVVIFGSQRIISNMHTVRQVMMGATLGLFYALLYYELGPLVGFLLILFIGVMLTYLSVKEIDKRIGEPLPNWVDKSMYESIEKKKNIHMSNRILSLYFTALFHYRIFISWNDLEGYLDKIVENIKNTGVKFDGVVGIKTGGAIISDYVSNKLGLPNYKVKLMRSELKCKKTESNTPLDLLKKNFSYKSCTFSVCDGINENLKGKNLILIDEIVQSGKTMDETYRYLKEEKGANYIYPTTILLYKKGTYQGNLDIKYILIDDFFNWPWGYDN